MVIMNYQQTMLNIIHAQEEVARLDNVLQPEQYTQRLVNDAIMDMLVSS